MKKVTLTTMASSVALLAGLSGLNGAAQAATVVYDPAGTAVQIGCTVPSPGTGSTVYSVQTKDKAGTPVDLSTGGVVAGISCSQAINAMIQNVGGLMGCPGAPAKGGDPLIGWLPNSLPGFVAYYDGGPIDALVWGGASSFAAQNVTNVNGYSLLPFQFACIGKEDKI